MSKGQAYAYPNKNKCTTKLVKTEFKDFENELQIKSKWLPSKIREFYGM